MLSDAAAEVMLLLSNLLTIFAYMLVGHGYCELNT
jgi:hypothetical protein